jgi:hypothetical protein
MSKQNVLAVPVQRITEAALQIMSNRASNLEPGESFSAADIASAVANEPTGPVALYLAKLIVTGIEHYPVYLDINRCSGAQ